MRITLPSARESLIMLCSLAVWLTVTAICIGFRPEHIWLSLLLAALFFITPATRRLMVALLPFIIFGISYDWMNIVHNYEVNPVDILPINNAERALFGIATSQGTLTPNEYFAQHTTLILDLLGGFFYLCWVPVPILFGLWLYFRHRQRVYLHFAIVFLLVNLIGFAGYYIHPAAPPWYAAKYGFDLRLGTPGDVAGLANFDHITGLGIFQALYGRNSNVFAAVPSLHSAYTLIALIYSFRTHTPQWMRISLAIITAGIWFTAVYTSHHYIIDVLLGILTAIIGCLLFEYILAPIPAISRFLARYTAYITPHRH